MKTTLCAFAALALVSASFKDPESRTMNHEPSFSVWTTQWTEEPATSAYPLVAAPPVVDSPPVSDTLSESVPDAEAPVVVADAPPPRAPAWPDDAALYRLRACESTDNYAINTGNGFYGAYQFLISTWNSVASRHRPDLIGVRPDRAAPVDQDDMVRHLWGEAGRAPWPVCGRRV